MTATIATPAEPSRATAPTRRRRTGNGEPSRVLRVVLPILAFGLFIGVWEAYVAIKDISVLLLPAPHQIVKEFFDNFSQLWELSKNTFLQAMAGLLFATALSIVVAGLTYGLPSVAKALENYSAIAKALPTVAIYPICTVFFGVGTAAVVAIITIGIFPIMFLYVIRGFTGTSEHDALMTSMSAGRFHRFADLVLPRSLSYLMAGLRAAAPTSIIITIVAQYFGGRVSTLGAFIRRESGNLHTLAMWGAVLAACLLGLVVFGAVSLLDRRFSRWRQNGD
jgi:ABC-type nitrate/sulfonate/bicarbonate transport system permease component